MPRDVGSFIKGLGGQDLEFTYTVRGDYSVTLGFTVRGKPYSFNLTRWKGATAQARFLGLFFAHKPRDAGLFGAEVTGQDDLPVYRMTEEQRIAAVVQASKDVIWTLDRITHEFERSVLDYAVWYREKHPETNTYSELITLVCCHAIVHSDFMAPNISYPLVQFAEE